MPNLKVRHLVQVSTFNLDCSLLTYDTTKNQTEADQNASEDSTKHENFIMKEKKQYQTSRNEGSFVRVVDATSWPITSATI